MASVVTLTAFLLAQLAAGQAGGKAPIDGMPTCKCKGALDPAIPRVACDENFGGMQVTECVNVENSYGDAEHTWNLYPSDYGSECSVWPEPKYAVCYNFNVTNGVKTVEKRNPPAKAWCDNEWCYVDSCKCDAPDITESSAFASFGVMKYSYASCGNVDDYTAENTDNVVGGGVCEVETSGAASIWMPVSILVGVVGATLM